MKKITLFCIILLLALPNVFSQKNQIQVSKNVRVIGSNWVNASHIEGTELLFPERIYQAHLDTSTNLLTVQLRKTNKQETKYKKYGKIVQYDMENDKILWTRDIDYKTTYIKNHSKTVIITESSLSYGLDVFTGEILWGGTHNIYFAAPKFNIALGYRSGYYDKELKVLEGLNLKTGRVAWKRELSREMGWNDILYINDSTLLVYSKGLHTININNGQGWDYHTVTYEFDHSRYGYPFIKSYASNIWIDSTSIYVTSKNEIVKLDRETGEAIWKTENLKNNAGGSLLIIKDSVIYLIHKGYKQNSFDYSLYETPFIAAFDKQTGTLQYITQTKPDQIPILDYETFEDEIYLLSKNRLARYNLKTGKLLKDKYTDDESYGNLKYFANYRIFFEDQDGNLLNLWQYDSTKVYLLNHKYRLFTVDKELNFNQIKEEKDLYLHYLSTDKYDFFSHNDMSIIVNKDKKIIAKIALSSGSLLEKDIFYVRVGKNLMIFDLKDI
jgi:outer membrane protein assembly factor BamB